MDPILEADKSNFQLMPTRYPYRGEMKTTPYEHQLKVVEYSSEMESFALFMDMGTGKTKILIDTIAHMVRSGMIDLVLVIAPNGVHTQWINEQVPIHLPNDIKVQKFVWGTKLNKSQALSPVPKGVCRILAMNYEGFSSANSPAFAQKYLKLSRKRLLILDESQSIKSPGAKRTKAIMKLDGEYRRIATGTPLSHKNPLDFYTQFKFLDPRIIDVSTMTAFKSMFCKLGGFKNKVIVGPRNMKYLLRMIGPYVASVRKSDCLDLPEKIYMTREVEMTKEQWDAYTGETYEVWEKLLELSEPDLTMAMTRIQKLQQIVSGFMILDSTTVAKFPSNRLKVMQEVIDEMPDDEQIIIWSRWTDEIEEILELLGDEAVGYYGEISQDRREANKIEFTSGKKRFFVGNPMVAGRGLNLANANNMIYVSRTWKLEERLQSEDRCHRIGLRKPLTIVDLHTPNTVDDLVLDNLKSKRDFSESTLKDLREHIKSELRKENSPL